jgi:hypothetical protein
LRSPERATGYREVRYPKMDEIQKSVESELRPLPTVSTDLNSPSTLGRLPAHV